MLKFDGSIRWARRQWWAAARRVGGCTSPPASTGAEYHRGPEASCTRVCSAAMTEHSSEDEREQECSELLFYFSMNLFMVIVHY